eukprot:TRINITY_DN1875_c0_g1_i6.p1 TRINITY_DN1875_c0_g1~~TRINITY_DN1875_c0_g1_i6.p1  ORF type:complete len:329 (-),score=63.41 TRINITY_DN1875_c0_g1_i6:148-1134(-)
MRRCGRWSARCSGRCSCRHREGVGVSIAAVGPPSLPVEVKEEQFLDGAAATAATGSVPIVPFPGAQAVTVVPSPPTRVARVPPSQAMPSLWVPRPASAAHRVAGHVSGGGQSQLVSTACPPLTPLVVGYTPPVAYPGAEPRYVPPPPQVQQLPPPPPQVQQPPPPSPPPPPPPTMTAAPLPPTAPVAASPSAASPDALQTYEDDALLPPQLLEQLALSVNQAPPEGLPSAAADLNASAEAPGAPSEAPTVSAGVPAVSAAALAVDTKLGAVTAATPDADASGVLPPGLPFNASSASLETLFASLADGGPPPFSLPRTASMLRLYTWTA